MADQIISHVTHIHIHRLLLIQLNEKDNGLARTFLLRLGQFAWLFSPPAHSDDHSHHSTTPPGDALLQEMTNAHGLLLLQDAFFWCIKHCTGS
jgi:hypothetical protein